MPHLSPMNWVMALLVFWLSMVMLLTKSWWTQISFMPFIIPKKSSLSMVTPSWKWN